MKLGVHAAFRASNQAVHTPFCPQAGSRAVGLEIDRIDHDGLVLCSVRHSQALYHPDKDALVAPAFPAIIKRHRAEIGHRLKVSTQDIVGLLGHIGRDTAGALSIVAPRKSGIRLQPVPDAAALERILDELPAKPFLVGERGYVRLVRSAASVYEYNLLML